MSLWQQTVSLGKNRVGTAGATTSWQLTESERRLLIKSKTPPAATVPAAAKSGVSQSCQLWQSVQHSPQSWRE